MDYTFSEAAAEHQEGIRTIYNESVLNSVATFDTEARSIEEQDRWWCAHRDRFSLHPVLVALTYEGKVAGWGSLSSFSPKPAYDVSAELSIYIAPDHRRYGLGLRLGKELFSRARTCGMLHTILARIAGPNEASKALVRRLGMGHVGTMHAVGRKFDTLLDVDIFQRML